MRKLAYLKNYYVLTYFSTIELLVQPSKWESTHLFLSMELLKYFDRPDQTDVARQVL